MALRKTIAQVGVMSYIAGTALGYLVSFIPFAVPQGLVFGIYMLGSFAFVLFLVVGVTPSNETEEWGSMWPLVGYDNAIDAIYTRGPWRTRFEEMDELNVQENVTNGMTTMFGD